MSEQDPRVRRGLRVDGATVRYEAGPGRGSRGGAEPALPAVDGVSFAVRPGEVVALTGPSGCGKSTLLRAIAGLEPLAGGSVHWDDEDLERVPPHRRGFGLMFQDGQLFAHRSVAENIAYGLRVQRAARGEREARVAELLALVELPDAGSRPVTALSGANGSAWRSLARSRRGRGCCCSTNRSRRSTGSCVSASHSTSPVCSGRRARPPSSSLTTSRRPRPSPIAPCGCAPGCSRERGEPGCAPARPPEREPRRG
ncbi:ABC transporter ATP-binding protein [Leucobacter soli]